MEEKKWIFFRVMVYLCMAGALLAITILLYYASSEFNSIASIEKISFIFLGVLLVQIAFNFLNIRLIHYYLFNKLLPEKNFSFWHNGLIIINICILLGLICLFVFGAIETFTAAHSNHHFNISDVIALIVVGIYTFITFYTITGSIRLRSYLKKYTVANEEEWLKHLGS